MNDEYQAIVEQDAKYAAGKMTISEYADIQRDRARLMLERDRALESADQAEALRQVTFDSFRDQRTALVQLRGQLAEVETILAQLQWELSSGADQESIQKLIGLIDQIKAKLP